MPADNIVPVSGQFFKFFIYEHPVFAVLYNTLEYILYESTFKTSTGNFDVAQVFTFASLLNG